MTEERFHAEWISLQERFYRVAYYILEDRSDALDAVQDLYAKLWKMRGTLDLIQNPAAYGTFLLRNLCIDRIRRRQPAEPLIEEPPGDPPPDERLMRQEALAGLLRQIEALPPGQRKLLSLHVLQGKSYDEIAAETGLSNLNIRVQVSLARKKLKRL